MTHDNGRPRVYTNQDLAMETVTARLTFWHLRMARRLGNGNVSAGIRLALETINEPMGTKDTIARPQQNKT